ncbi:MAG TPA: hypothetical protein VK891_12790, partial [Euzebyales bacterium]|nr:hypothetical protein [Euzebyales bacterium]
GATHAAGGSDTPAPAANVGRIVELVERLRTEPPPRQVVVDLGDLGIGKLVVSLRGDTVVVEPLDAGTSLDPQWREDLDAALRERGWSFDGDQHPGRDQQQAPATADIPAAGPGRRPDTTRTDDGQLRL